MIAKTTSYASPTDDEATGCANRQIKPSHKKTTPAVFYEKKTNKTYGMSMMLVVLVVGDDESMLGFDDVSAVCDDDDDDDDNDGTPIASVVVNVPPATTTTNHIGSFDCSSFIPSAVGANWVNGKRNQRGRQLITAASRLARQRRRHRRRHCRRARRQRRQ
jgi:hypothetical protein